MDVSAQLYAPDTSPPRLPLMQGRDWGIQELIWTC